MILEKKFSYFGNIWYQSGQTTWASENYCSSELLLGVDRSFSARITSSHKFRAMFLSQLLSQTATLAVGSSCNVRYTYENRTVEFSVCVKGSASTTAGVCGRHEKLGEGAETGELVS